MTIQHLKLAACARTARSKNLSKLCRRAPASTGAGVSLHGLPRVAGHPVSHSRSRCMRDTRSSPAAPQPPSSMSPSFILAPPFVNDVSLAKGKDRRRLPTRRDAGAEARAPPCGGQSSEDPRAASSGPSASSSSSSLAWSQTRASRMARSAGSKWTRSSVGPGSVAAANRLNVAATTSSRISCASGPRTLSTSLANCFSEMTTPAADADRARVRTSSAASASRHGACVASSVRVGTARVQTTRSGRSCVVR
mmetsp:Transcript_30049/g.105664  ORF Transcript_30049/g.105664 Transcript_30049/m.105664 type:complete len:251 (+) Transcript_30049:850-1602(+)